jgi:hypothetical protein
MDKRKTISAKNLPTSRQFGQPNANPTGNPAGAGKIGAENRNFYKFFSEATQAELKEYVSDKSKPQRWRLFVKRYIKYGTIRDDFELTNQICGKPKEFIEFLDNRVTKEEFLKETEDFPHKNDRVQ